MNEVKGNVYKRADSPFWWMWFYDAKAERVSASCKTADEKVARKRLAAVLRRVKEQRTLGVDVGPLTHRRLLSRWLADRRQRNIGSVKADESWLKHADPFIGEKMASDVRPGDIRHVIRTLKARGELAPRSVRHVYGTLHTLYEDAVADELVDSNPCVLKRGELPKKRDKNPTWRAGAVFTKDELGQLLFDKRIDSDRRLFYTLTFLTGCRAGEVSALTWEMWDRTKKPLGSLTVARSFNTRTGRVKLTKTEVTRVVPVHPVLAKILAARKLELGAGAKDLICPNADGSHRTNSQNWKRLQKDLDTLELRGRRVHDTRRTFISLAMADGARKDILRWVTHAPENDVVNDYMTLPWATLCEEVAKLQVRPVTPLLRKVSGKSKLSSK